MRKIQKLILAGMLVFACMMIAGCDSPTARSPMSNDYKAYEDGYAGSRIVVNSYLDIRTKDVAETAADIKTKTKELKGFVRDENLSFDDSPYGRITVAIPKESADSFVSWIRDVYQLDRYNVSVVDVSANYDFDEQSLEKLQSQLELYTSLMDDPELTLSDKIELIDHISDVEARIAYMTRDLEDVDESVAYRDVSISINGQQRILWERDWGRNTLGYVVEALQIGATGVFVLIAFFLPFSPFVILIIVLIRRSVKKKKQKSLEAAAVAAAQTSTPLDIQGEK